MLQMQWQLCGYRVPGYRLGRQVPVGCSGGCHPALGRKVYGVHPGIRPSCDELVGSPGSAALGHKQTRGGAGAGTHPQCPCWRVGQCSQQQGTLTALSQPNPLPFMGSMDVPYPREHPTPPAYPAKHFPASAPPDKLAHGWAQPGLLYPQTLFMWHIYSKDWNN